MCQRKDNYSTNMTQFWMLSKACKKQGSFDGAKISAHLYNNWVTHVKQILIEDINFYDRQIVKVELMKITRLCLKQTGII